MSDVTWFDAGTVSTADVLRVWDSGGSIFTIEMGGMGPGYEQALQIAAVELTRALLESGLPSADDPELEPKIDTALHKAVDGLDLGLSGAQAGAAKDLAYRAVRDGWKEMVASAPEDRRIQISQTWPKSKP